MSERLKGLAESAYVIMSWGLSSWRNEKVKRGIWVRWVIIERL